MEANSDVRDGMQRVANALCALMCQYMLDAINTTRLGLDIGDGLDKLRCQCESDLRDLIRWLYFLEAQPQIGAASSHATVTQMLADATAGETAFVGMVNELAAAAFKANEMAVFHGLQHLAKFHSVGGGLLGATDRMGHIVWLQKQNWQLREFGEKEFEETKV